MINWNLYKGRDTERGKKVYIGFCELLENENYKLIGEYVNATTKAGLQCDKGHKYSVNPSDFKSGHRCPICSGNHPKTAKLYFIKQVEGEGYKLIGEYVNARTKVELECDKGHRYSVVPYSFKQGRRCSICSGHNSKTAKLEFINQVKNERYKLIGKYVNNRIKVELECDKGHRYFVTPNSFKNGSRCPICDGQHSETSKSNFIKQVEKEDYKVIVEYVNSSTKVEIECNKGHRYFVTPNNFKKGTRCPHCSINSHGEILTKKILDEYSCKYESQKKFDGLIGLGGGQLSYDFFVDDYLLIEIQGEQHYRAIEWYGGEEQYKKQQEHDRRKREFAKENDYELLEILYFGVKDLDKLEKILREKLSKKYLNVA